MALRFVLYLMMALGLAGFGGVGWMATHTIAPPPPTIDTAAPAPVAHSLLVLTAARPLRAGALVTPDDMTGLEVAAPTPDMVADTPAARASVLGGMMRHNLPVGAPLRAESVLRPMDRGFLAAVLAPGMLAVSLGVDPVSGAAGLIWPGDWVDVILTQSLDSTAAPAGRRVSGETMLAGIRVIAIDQQLMQGALGSEAVERNVRTVTLEVTSAQAERIAVGGRLGKLSLAVHAATTDPAASTLGAGSPTVPASLTGVPQRPVSPASVTWAGDVSSAYTAPSAKSAEPLRVYSGPEKLEEVHF